jgi:hypothetical protein
MRCVRSLPGRSPAAPPQNSAAPGWCNAPDTAPPQELVRITTGATTLDADRLAILARQVRDEIDEAGSTDREQARYTARSLRLLKRTGGMTRLVWVMDPETATTTDSTQLLGSGAPVVRVLVAAEALHAGARHDTPKRSPSIRTGHR